MGNRPVEVFLLCDFKDTPAASALSDQLSLNGIVSSYGDDLSTDVLNLCQSVAVCVGENTRSLSSTVCDELKLQLSSSAFRINIVFLPDACTEDSVWLPSNWIEFKSGDDPVALRELIAVIRPPLQVFLCHSKTDKPVVRELYPFLIAEGFRPWLDEKDLIAGQDWELAIRNAVRASHVVVVCLSRIAVTRIGFVQKEIRLALDVADEQPEGSIFLIPARLEDCDVPSRLNKWQWVDLWKPDGYQRLLRALKLRAKELALTAVCGLTIAEVAHLATWRPPPSGKTVLIALDNPDLIGFVTRMLESMGWTAVTAETAERAIELMTMPPDAPSIALLDYYLPDVSGVAFGIKLREHAPAIGIIITSRDEPTLEDSVTCGENDFYVLEKPFLAAELLQILKHIRQEQIRKRGR